MQFLSRHATRLAKTVTSFARITTLRGNTEPAPLTTTPVAGDEAAAGDEHIYRLKHWPQLPETHKTADVYRVLSVMSHRPVNRRWMLSAGRIRRERLDDLLRRLVEQGAVEVIDPRSFPARAT